MQHLDEGTIHAWLDGALPPDEAARAEAHVAECADCAAKVAEARGLVAASSRILTALDDVPRGVVFARRARPPISRTLLQAAAVLVVVAAGGLLVMRSRPNSETGHATVATRPEKSLTVAEAPQKSLPAAEQTLAPPPKTVPAPTPRPATARSKAVPVPLVAAAPATHDTAINFTLSRDENRLQAVVTTGVATTTAAAAPLKVVKVERVAGGTQTTYEIAPDRSVTLTEPDSIAAQVTSGHIAGGRVMERRVLSAPLSAKPAVNTIQWTEASTGKNLILSGPFSLSELESLKVQIEALRVHK